MTTLYPALLGVTVASIIVACFAALYVIELKRQRWTLPVSLNPIDREPNSWWASMNLDEGGLSRAGKKANGKEKWMEPWYEDEAAKVNICPACGQGVADRISGGRRNRGEKLYSDNRTGAKYNAGLVGDADTRARWFYYIPRAHQKDWEALGWKVTEIGAPHDTYSILGEWSGEGPPIKPM